MLQSSFILLNGIGEFTERRLWQAGISDWYTFLEQESVPGITRERKRLYNEALTSALHHLACRHARYFSLCLKPRDHWRLYAAFKSCAVYLDIETTGGPPEQGEVTVVGLYGSGRMTTLVRGQSLTRARLEAELAHYDLLITFYGSVFDLPYLRAKFPGLRLDHAHLDLCFAARKVGLRGGLKQIEAQLGIARAAHLHGLDGWDAVRLWQGWLRGDRVALDRLLEYNEADTRNLERLGEVIYDRLCGRHSPDAIRRAVVGASARTRTP